jgi:hypothetical protein
MRRTDGQPITPGDVMPKGRCQPPVNAMKLMEALSLEELRRVARCMIIWAPEAFELGLERLSDDRAASAAWRRELAAGGAQ